MRRMNRIDVSPELGACLRDRRVALRMTQAELAKALRTNIPTISRVENAQRDMLVSELEAYARALRTSGSTVLRAAERVR
jgi:transcriptional regulator with XRE-family HTH domain